MIKRMWTVSLAFLLAVTLLAACTGKSPQQIDNGDNQPGPAATVEEEAVGEKTLDVSWLGLNYYPSAKSGTFPQQTLESRFNLKIEPIFLGSDYEQKKPVMMSGGQVPDIIWEPNPINVQSDATQGFLAEIPYKLIKQHAPHMIELVNKHAPASWMYSYVGGKNYGIPTVYPNGAFTYPGVWRMDLLKSVGIEKVPETLTEMHDALARLVQEKKVKYGMTSSMKYWWTSFPEIFGAYRTLPFSWMEADGEVAWGGIQPATKQALQLLRDWYKEGLIDPEFVTDDPGGGKSVDVKFQNGMTAYESTVAQFAKFDATNPTSLISTVKKLIPDAELAPGVLPTGPDGKRGQFRWGAAGNVIAFGKQLADDEEKLIRILKMLDAQVTDEKLYVETKAGQQGVMWDFVNPSLGSSGGIKMLPPYDAPDAWSTEIVSTNLAVASFFNMQSNPDINAKYISKKEQDFLNQYNSPQYVMTDAFLKPDVLPSAKKYLDNLTNFQLTAFSQIIRGDKDIAYFDEFVNYWKENGGDQLTQEAKEIFNTRQQIYDQVGAK